MKNQRAARGRPSVLRVASPAQRILEESPRPRVIALGQGLECVLSDLDVPMRSGGRDQRRYPRAPFELLQRLDHLVPDLIRGIGIEELPREHDEPIGRRSFAERFHRLMPGVDVQP